MTWLSTHPLIFFYYTLVIFCIGLCLEILQLILMFWMIGIRRIRDFVFSFMASYTLVMKQQKIKFTRFWIYIICFFFGTKNPTPRLIPFDTIKFAPNLASLIFTIFILVVYLFFFSFILLNLCIKKSRHI